ncbi:MAG: hypothetical protein EPO07_10500 [Verrucomicrobia bacterium]|nr:MAG: hypothetical protein EPO07_10500 [Verrucomicrobiota bacterium]
MRRNARSITTSPEIVKHIDGLTEANFKLLTRLIPWLDAHEKIQQKFRYAMIYKLTRLDAAISMLLVGQQIRMQKRQEYFAEKLDEDAKAAEEFISEQSEAKALKLIRFIHSESPAPEVRRDRRRKWTGWEI